jgi:hypothetical protein
LLVIAAAFLEAWLARKLSTEFQESQYIFQAILLIVLVISLAVPVIFLTQETPDASILLGSATIFVICMGILLLIFLPKMTFKQWKTSVVTSYTNGSNVHVSGLEAGRGSREEIHSMVSSTDLYPMDDGASCDGERILAVKDRRELAEEVALLKKLLRAKDRREQARHATPDAMVEDVEGPSPNTVDTSPVQKSCDKSLDTYETPSMPKNKSNTKIEDDDTPHNIESND